MLALVRILGDGNSILHLTPPARLGRFRLSPTVLLDKTSMSPSKRRSQTDAERTRRNFENRSARGEKEEESDLRRAAYWRDAVTDAKPQRVHPYLPPSANEVRVLLETDPPRKLRAGPAPP